MQRQRGCGSRCEGGAFDLIRTLTSTYLRERAPGFPVELVACQAEISDPAHALTLMDGVWTVLTLDPCRNDCWTGGISKYQHL